MPIVPFRSADCQSALRTCYNSGKKPAMSHDFQHSLLIGVVAMGSEPWALDENYVKMEGYVREEARLRAEVVITPEGALDGSFATFSTDKRTQFAVLREIEIIGEAAKRVTAPYKAAHPVIPWRAMAGMRDVLVREDGIAATECPIYRTMNAEFRTSNYELTFLRRVREETARHPVSARLPPSSARSGRRRRGH